MELCTRKTCCTNLPNRIPDSPVEQCFQDYKLQDKVDALKNYLGINNSCDDNSYATNFSDKSRSRKCGVFGVKECLQPPVPSTFQALVTELRDTVRSSYWNKEIGKTVYLVPHLPAGCDPLETTFGKATTRDGHGVAEILKPRDYVSENGKERVHALYRKSHNDYNPSEQVDRKYEAPFSKFSSYGTGKKADFSGKKVAKCLEWFNSEPMTLVNRRLADYYNRSVPQLGKVRNSDMELMDVTFGKSMNQGCSSVADTLSECSAAHKKCRNYCSEYAEAISKSCESSGGEKIVAAGLPSMRTGSSRSVLPTGSRDEKNLGAQTSIQAVISPNIFTQMGLSNADFSKPRKYEEIRSIYENIGIHFPGDSFDALWNEGLRKDCTGGVCVETFRKLLPKSALKNCNNESE